MYEADSSGEERNLLLIAFRFWNTAESHRCVEVLAHFGEVMEKLTFVNLCY